MKKKQLTRERIFRNNRVVLTHEERLEFITQEFKRQDKKRDVKYLIKLNVDYDIDDPFISVSILGHIGYSKRMPNDVPNDRIAIQVAVSRLIKRLKNG